MPRQQGIAIANNFIKGLVTTASSLNFPEDAATQANNCNFTIIGTVERRTGIDIESTATSQTIVNPDTGAYAEFVWTNVGGFGNKTFVVVQQYQTLYFYDITNTTQVGSSFLTSINFASFLGAGITGDPGLLQCQFAAGNGFLFITNPICDPFFITYAQLGNSLTTTAIKIQTRDFLGLPESQFSPNVNPITFRPTTTIGNLPINFPNHYYNLINQGWGLTTALTLWMGAESFAPSNADYTAAYRSSPTVPFTPSYVGTVSVGSAPAAKGHFVLTEFNPDRGGALVADGFTSIGSPGIVLYDPSLGTPFGFASAPSSGPFSLSQAFDGILSTSNGASFGGTHLVDTLAIGKNFGSVKPLFNTTLYISFGPQVAGVSMTFNLYGSNSLPATATSGTLLGSNTQTGLNTNTQSIFSIANGGGSFQYYWIQTVLPSNIEIIFNEIQLTYQSATTANAVLSRPSSVAFYAGRVWYSGQQAAGMTSNIYFSQILAPTSTGGSGPLQAGYCYQKNDPTSELLSDLLPDDGGVIQIQDMGIVRKLFPFKSGLIVFASNGVWLIEGEGTQGGSFQANNYLVRKLTGIGCIAANSVVNYKGTPVWWAEDGVYTLNYNPNYNSYDPQPLSYQVINEFFRAIPVGNLQYVKGIYDTVNQLVIWLFNSNPNLASTDIYKYDSALLLNGFTGAFFPWTFAYTSGGNGPFIRGALYVQDGLRQQNPVTKFLTTNTTGTVPITTLFWSDNTSGSYYDWSVASSTPQDAPASFTSAYRLEGQTQKFFQPSYVFVFFKSMPNAQCAVQAFYDFAIDANSNKFSSVQFAYPLPRVNSPSVTSFRSVNYRKLKMRGKGRVMQLFFSSLPGQPFSIYGWSLDESVSPAV